MSTPIGNPPFRSFSAFWPYYLAQHRKARTRAWHYAGLIFAGLCFVAALVKGGWFWAALGALAGYGLAWIGHGLAEHNRPATFSHPLWSLLGDLRMAALALTGRLKAEMARHRIE